MIHLADFNNAADTDNVHTDFIDRDGDNANNIVDHNPFLDFDNAYDTKDYDTFRCNSRDNWFISPVPLGSTVSSLSMAFPMLLPFQ